MKQINQELYNQILENMPIICVDGVIINENNEVLFLKRKNEPEKNKWWFPGGRILKNELLSDAIIRKMKEELDVNVDILSYLGFTETIFDSGPNKIQVHTINFTFLLIIKNGCLNLDNDHSTFIWTKDFEKLQLNQRIINLLKNEKLDLWT